MHNPAPLFPGSASAVHFSTHPSTQPFLSLNPIPARFTLFLRTHFPPVLVPILSHSVCSGFIVDPASAAGHSCSSESKGSLLPTLQAHLASILLPSFAIVLDDPLLGIQNRSLCPTAFVHSAGIGTEPFYQPDPLPHFSLVGAVWGWGREGLTQDI